MTYTHLKGRPAPPPPPTHPWWCMWGCRAHANDMDTLREHERECEQRPIGWLAGPR